MTRFASLLLVAACGPMYPQSSTQSPGNPSANEPVASQQGAPQGDVPGAAPADPYDAPARRPAPPAPPPVPPTASKPTGLAAQFIAAHNARRGKHCAQPLTWSPQLAGVAQGWANTLVRKGCKFEHSGGQYGENLAAGSSGSLDPEGVVAMWYDEIKSFDFAGGGFSMQTGHFTQVVWRGTSQVGCGVASCNGLDIYVCNYDPAGNVEGEYRQNVVAARECR